MPSLLFPSPLTETQGCADSMRPFLTKCRYFADERPRLMQASDYSYFFLSKASAVCIGSATGDLFPAGTSTVPVVPATHPLSSCSVVTPRSHRPILHNDFRPDGRDTNSKALCRKHRA